MRHITNMAESHTLCGIKYRVTRDVTLIDHLEKDFGSRCEKCTRRAVTMVKVFGKDRVVRESRGMVYGKEKAHV